MASGQHGVASRRSRSGLGAWVRGWFAPPRRAKRALAVPLEHRRAVIEPLESRALLSASPLAAFHATSTLRHVKGFDGVGTASPMVLAPDQTATPQGGYTPAQIRAAYGMNSISFSGGTVTGDGTGQTIAIIDDGGDSDAAADLKTFSTAFGLPTFNSGAGSPTFTQLNENGGAALPADGTWGFEESLDIEWAHTMAPMANLILFEADPTDFNGLFTAVKTAANTPGVVAVSMSWGGPESSMSASSESSYDSTYFTTPAGHMGGSATLGGTLLSGSVTFLASAGDSGVYNPGVPGTIVSDYPAASPNVVAVGGTTLTVNGDGSVANPYSYGSESGWGSGTQSWDQSGDGGGGGGISIYETQPAYQSGVVSKFSTTARTYPDVSADADPASGVDVCDSLDLGAATPWSVVGGTSLACPLWAGIVAVADQGRAIQSQGSLDGPSQTLPLLYQMSTANFHDITTGAGNGPAPVYQPPKSPGVGYDLNTGIGSPAANLVVPACLVGPTIATPAAANPNPVVTGTTTNLTVLGAEGGSDAGLTYSWSATTLPAGAAQPNFNPNGTNAAKASTATFSAAGNYVLTATITDQNGVSAYSSVSVVVDQAVTSVAVSPTPVTMNVGTTQKFTVDTIDQFGNAFTTEPAFTATWSATAGTINAATGLFTAPASPNPGITITASNVTVTGGTGTYGPVTGTVIVVTPQFSVSSPTVIGPDSGTTTVPVSIQLSGLGGTYTSSVTINYKTSDNSPQYGAATGSAEATSSNPADYESVSGKVTFTPAQIAAAQSSWVPVRVTANGNQYQYAIWQNDIVWVGTQGQIFFNNGATTVELSPLGSNSQSPAIDGSYILWSQAVGSTAGTFQQIMVYNLATKTTTQLTSDTFNDSEPQLFGVCATWCGNTFNGPAVFYDADLTSAGAAMTAAGATETGTTVTITTAAAENLIVGEGVLIAGVGVSGYNGLWMVTSVISPTQFTFTATAAGLAASGGGTVTPQTAVQVSTTGVDCYFPQISGTTGAGADTYVVWYGSHGLDQDIYLYDADSGQTTDLTNNSAAGQGSAGNESDQGVQINGSNVVWQGTDAKNYQIYLYQIGTHTITPITSDAVDNLDPGISGDNIVWTKTLVFSPVTGTYQSQVFDYNFNTQTTTQLSDLVVDNMYYMPAEFAKVSGNQVAWRQMVSNSPVEWDIYTYDLSSATAAPPGVDISNNHGVDWSPVVSSTGMVAWSANDGASFDIFTANRPALGSVTAWVNLTIFSDTRVEPDRVFYVTATLAGSTQSATGTVTILNQNGNLDYGSAPSPYPTSLAADGARNLIVAGEYLGKSEVSGQSDGVTFNSPIVPGSMASVTVVASKPGKLDAWMDFNDNGSWNDSGEEIFKDVSLVAGANTLTFSVPAGALPGPTWARFRYSQAGGLGPTGMPVNAMDGETEDYNVNISQPTLVAAGGQAGASGAGSIVQNGKIVTVTGGSGGNDVFVFTAGATDIVNLNGTIETFPAGSITNVVFQGSVVAGSPESAILNGSAGSTTVSLQPASGGVGSTMTDILGGNKVTVAVYGTQYVLATSGGGNDTAQLSDPSGTGTATLRPNDATLTGTGFSLEATGFSTARAYATKSGDKVNFGDLPNAVSMLVATNVSSQFTSRVGASTYTSYAQGFTSCYATASNTADQAQLIDYLGSSTLQANGTTAQLSSNSGAYLLQASGFGYIQAFGRIGGNDKATMSDPAGSAASTFIAGTSAAMFIGPGFNDTAYNFSSVFALAQSAADTASLSDTAGNNILVDKPLDALFHGTAFSLEAKSFTTTTVTSGTAGADTANLYDMANVANTLVAYPDQVTLSASNSNGALLYSNTLKSFNQLVAYANVGKGDTAQFFDGPNAATFTSGWNTSAAAAIATAGAKETGTTVTITTATAETLAVGQSITIAGVGVSGYNGQWTVASVISPTQFTYADTATHLAASGGGTVAGHLSVTGNVSTMTGVNSKGRAYSNQAQLFQHIQFNPTVPAVAIAATGATETGTTVTVTTAAADTLQVGEIVTIAGVGVSGYNGQWMVTSVISPTQFTYTDTTAGLAVSGGGTVAVLASHPVDQIFLTDSPGNDSLVATGNQAVGSVGPQSVDLSSTQAGYLYDILIQNIAGDTVTATDSAGGTDAKNVATAAVDYVLNTVGAW